MQKERIQLGSRVYIQVHKLMLLFFLSGTAFLAVIVQPKKRDVKTGVMGTRCTDLRVTLTVQGKLVLWELDADRLEGNLLFKENWCYGNSEQTDFESGSYCSNEENYPKTSVGNSVQTNLESSSYCSDKEKYLKTSVMGTQCKL